MVRFVATLGALMRVLKLSLLHPRVSRCMLLSLIIMLATMGPLAGFQRAVREHTGYPAVETIRLTLHALTQACGIQERR
jgi:hypothetical protein